LKPFKVSIGPDDGIAIPKISLGQGLANVTGDP
jgi:hypothetical protein